MSEIIQHWLERIGQTHSTTAEIITVCIIGFGLLLCALSSLFLTRRDVGEDEMQSPWGDIAAPKQAENGSFHVAEDTR